jgi:site-specific recombinase XerD
MAVIRKRKYKHDWMYVVDFMHNGKRRTISTGTKSRTLATQILGDIQARIARGTFSLDHGKKKDIYLKDFIDEVLNYAASYKQQSTMELERGYLPQVLSIIGNRNLRSIDQYTADLWQSKLQKGMKSSTTCNIMLRMVRAAFNVAKRWGYIDENPFAHLKEVKVQERRLFLLDREIAMIFKLIDEDIVKANGKGHRDNVVLFRTRFKLLIEFLLNTGLRREEMLRLRMDHVDLVQNVIYIEKTKTHLMRAIPLNKRAREIIIELGVGLFSKLNRHDVTCKFSYYLSQAGLVGFKLHSLRHTFATKLLARGVDLYTISRLLGHTDMKTSMIYAKTNVETLRQVVEKLDERGDAIVTWSDKIEKGQ